MKALVIIAVVAAVGFGGYKLYEKRKASATKQAFTFLICDTGFMDEASGAMREASNVNLNSSLNGVMAAAQKSMENATKLAAWTRTNLPADKVSALSGAASLGKAALGSAMQEGYDAAKLRCPDKVEGLNPGVIGMTVGFLVAALANGA